MGKEALADRANRERTGKPAFEAAVVRRLSQRTKNYLAWRSAFESPRTALRTTEELLLYDADLLFSREIGRVVDHKKPSPDYITEWVKEAPVRASNLEKEIRREELHTRTMVRRLRESQRARAVVREVLRRTEEGTE